jgi:glycosyltransferase involved in cell wall biosynthesis
MRIGLIARWLELPAGGAKHYTLNLIRALLKADEHNRYIVFHKIPEAMGTFPTAREVLVLGKSKLQWDYLNLPIAVKRERIDLLWTPSYVVPFPIRCRSVASVLDLAYFYSPGSYRILDVLYMRSAMASSFRRVDALLAISEYTKNDIVRLFPFAESKVTVTHLAPSTRYQRTVDKESLEAVRQRYSLNRPFIFYAGSISPRKGCSFLVDAFAMLKRTKRIPHKLVLTGGWTWGTPNIVDVIREMDLEDEVIVLGEVAGQDMPALYSLAELLVYPSTYEGFGLPVLEAMACSCPVVCSNLTSIPEVAGDAALSVDPRDVSALAAAIYTALTDLTTRKRLIERGVERAASFTWEKTARKTLDVFEKTAHRERSEKASWEQSR